MNKDTPKLIIIDEAHEINNEVLLRQLMFNGNNEAIMVTKTTRGTVWAAEPATNKTEGME